jgi:DNA-binding transcriptional ArsR family regulator
MLDTSITNWLLIVTVAATAEDVFRALADPTRRSIFERLVREGEQTVRALTDAAGVSQPAVSKHLRLLKVAHLVRDRPEGRLVHYRAEPEGLATLAGWLKFYAAFWDEKFDRLEALLQRMDP